MVGTGAGLALGVATVLRRDILPLLFGKLKNRISEMTVERVLLVLILLAASVLSMGPLGDTILVFAFMSMGLRGATIFVPLCSALWRPGSISPKVAFFGIVLGPVSVLIFGLWGNLPFDPLFIGVFASFFVMLGGTIANFHKKRKQLL